MNTRRQSELLQRAAQRAGHRYFFVASALSAYQLLHGLSEEELTAFLGCARAALPTLALCRLPHAAAPSFRAEVERIASYTGANSMRLAQLFREVESTTALRSAQQRQEGATGPSVLLAARDRAREVQPGATECPEEPRDHKAELTRHDRSVDPTGCR